MERRILVLYGSQTGTAQEVAERVGREAKRLHFCVEVSSFDEFPIRNLPIQPLVVYVTSTTGQGEEPDNMKKSWRLLLRKNLPPDSLACQQFGVLGLGDSGYVKFNLVAKKLNKRLIQLGASQLLPPGLGDDQHDLGPDFVIDSWLESFWNLSLQLYPLPAGTIPISKDVLPEPKYQVVWLDEPRSQTEPTNRPEINEPKTCDSFEYSPRNPFLGKVIGSSRVTPDEHFQDVRLVEIDIVGSNIQYSPGDVGILQPHNLQENIDSFFALFPNLDQERKFLLESTDPSYPLPPTSILPSPCTIRQAVTTFFDIQSIPKRYFFELLSHFTTDPLEKEKFLEFNTAEGQQDLYEYCNRPRRHILEVLYDFRHTTPNIPFQYLFDLIPQVKPRSFSIASSQAKHQNNLQLLVAVVNYRSSLKASRQGLCSTWLSRLSPGDTLKVWTRKGTLRFPENPETPCVMVGPGTGIAPFRSYISHVMATNGSRPLLLFFGCRNRNSDFFFSSDWSSAGDNVTVLTAFSRDQEDKIYVQHVMDNNRQKIRELILEKSGSFFVAGNSKSMPTQVREALVAALAETLGQDEAENFVEKMEMNGRYQTETWS